MDTQLPDLGFANRSEVLSASVMIEGLTSTLLATLLGIKDANQSISFGNKSSALSFNQKIHLLIDLGAIAKENKSKLINFASIRNQFVHNLEAFTFEKCFSFLDGTQKWLLDNYSSQQIDTKEKQLKDATFLLAQDCLKIVAAVNETIAAKIHKDIEADVKKRSEIASWLSLEKGLEFLQEKINELTNGKQIVETHLLENLPKEVIGAFYKEWKNKFEE